MSESIQFAPFLPVYAIAIPAFLAVGFSVFAGGHRPFWLALRILLIAALALLALNPQRVNREAETLPDIALMLVDKTGSETVGDRARIRDDQAERLRQMAEADPDLDLMEVDAHDTPDGTRLNESLREGLARIPAERLAGAVVLTDGISNDTSPDRLAKLTAPVHVLTTGNPSKGDRSLRVWEAPKFGFVGEDVTFRIQVDDFGQDIPQKQALVTLQVAGQPPIQAKVETGGPVNVAMPLKQRGNNLVEINVAPAGEELTLRNNRVAVQVTGVRERLRVLLVTGEPYEGVRAWRNLLKSDPAVDLVHFTILRPPTKRETTPLDEMALIAFPTRELFVNKLKDFDLVIFDRYTRRGVLPFLYLENVAQYVENGGALLVAAGPPFAGPASLARTFLANVLPARPDGEVKNGPVMPTLTDIGKRHPVTATLAGQSRHWGHWGRVIGAQEITGQTVLQTDKGDPLLVLDRVGEGRVALLLSDQAWLWSRGFDGGGPQYGLYRRLAHWLMKEPELEEESLSGKIQGKELDIQMQSLSDTPPEVEVTTPSGQKGTVKLKPTSPGKFSVKVPVAGNPGILTLKSGKLLAVATRGTLNNPEFADLQINDKALESWRTASGGGLLSLDRIGKTVDLRRTRPGDRQWGMGWLGLQRNHYSVTTSLTRENLIPPWIALLVGLLLFSLLWWREGRE